MRFAAGPGDRLRFSGFRGRHNRRLASVRAEWLLANSPRRANFFADFRTLRASRAALDVAPRMRRASLIDIPRGPWRAGRRPGPPDFGTYRPERRVSAHSRTFGRPSLNLALASASANRPNPMVGWNNRDFANARQEASNLGRLILRPLLPGRARFSPTFVRSKRSARNLALSHQEFALSSRKRAGGAPRNLLSKSPIRL